MKYVILKKKLGDSGLFRYLPVIFPSSFVHADIAECVGNAIKADGVHSAGEISSTVLFGCFGESATLKLKSGDDDDTIMSMCDYGGNIF